MSCDVCGGAVAPIAELQVHGCHQCAECGLVVCLPLPENVATQYEGADYFLNLENPDVAAAKVDGLRPFAAALRKVLPAGARVFEFGSATGALVRALRDEGLDAVGSDISPAAAATAASVYGVEITVGPAETVPIPNPCDAVVGFHVIEHLRSPKAFLERLSSALIPPSLLVLEVPDFGAKMREQLGPAWPHFRPGEHLYHFDERSLGRALARHGFSVIRRERVGGFGLLQPGTGTEGVADPGDTPVPKGWRRPLYESRKWVYKVPGGRTAVRTVNTRVGYDILHRNAGIRLWARRV